MSESDLAVINAIAIIVLVGVNVYYAVQNRRVLEEMRSARLMSVRPRLALGVHMAGPTFGLVTVSNVGTGAALAIDVTLQLEGARGRGSDSHRWHEHVMLPLERAEFLPPQELGSMESFCQAYPIVSLRGTMRDGLDHEHVVEDLIDMKGWWDTKQDIRQRWEAERERETVKWLEQIAKGIRDLATASKQRAELRRRRRGRVARLRNRYALWRHRRASS